MFEETRIDRKLSRNIMSYIVEKIVIFPYLRPLPDVEGSVIFQFLWSMPPTDTMTSFATDAMSGLLLLHVILHPSP